MLGYCIFNISELRTGGARIVLTLHLRVGKFTKTGKFRLHVTSLNVIAPHARYKVR